MPSAEIINSKRNERCFWPILHMQKQILICELQLSTPLIPMLGPRESERTEFMNFAATIQYLADAV